MQKKEGGTYNFAFDENAEIFLVRWNDNSAVTVAINVNILESFFGVKRRIRGKKHKVNERVSNLINSYNKHMGSVDHHDGLAGLHSIKIRRENDTDHFLYVHWICLW
ncbi:hypothetical protein TNCV_631861 [Trichonephila clavipes]|nr:hypothetical protein TNCV_631861 [Trichonephila clavipes]